MWRYRMQRGFDQPHFAIETGDLNWIWRAMGKVLYAVSLTDEVYLSSTFEEKHSSPN